MTRAANPEARLTADKNVTDPKDAIYLSELVLQFTREHEKTEIDGGAFDANEHILAVVRCLKTARSQVSCIEQAGSGCRSADVTGDAAASATRATFETVIAEICYTDGMKENGDENIATVLPSQRISCLVALICRTAAAHGRYVGTRDHDANSADQLYYHSQCKYRHRSVKVLERKKATDLCLKFTTMNNVDKLTANASEQRILAKTKNQMRSIQCIHKNHSDTND